MAVSDLDYSIADGVGTILLNRPERHNAFTPEMTDTWAGILADARTDTNVRVLVLTGAGRSFCSGVDLDRRYGEAPPTPLERKSLLSDRVHRIPLLLEDLDKPIIAAINGAAVGAGLDMALMCDMRVMARNARLSEGYIRVGMVPGDGSCYYLPRLVGPAKTSSCCSPVTSSTQTRRCGWAWSTASWMMPISRPLPPNWLVRSPRRRR
jgi:enoyl-CoA hydratase/carnithine racemase